MGNQINLILGVHNHQPVDNWDHVIEDAYKKCYQPFLDVLEAHPKVGMSIHYTGYLLDWLFENHPELISQLQRLIQRGQVEILGGAYYEPILAIIPDTDKKGQIEKLSNRVEALLGQRPQGLWLAERVWEPHLVKPIAETGIQYLFLDDSHFKAAGLDDSQLHGRYTSEEQGRTVDIFPVDKTLRYQIPYASPQEIIDYLGAIASPEGQRAAIYFDDGEKMGVWPGSYGLVYREKWLDRFFTALEQNSEWLRAITPSQYIAEISSFGRVYLPTASYSEMMEWALPAQQANQYAKGLASTAVDYRQFFRAGFWRNFLVKYPEANNIHKKMLYVSEKVHRATAKSSNTTAALDELWKGQSNDIFWHGVFGGLYLTNLRTANYQHLLRAETLADQILQGSPFLNAVQYDLDCDGHADWLLESTAQNLYFSPQEGGSLFELDYRPKHFNLLDTLARRYEPYHDKLITATEEGNSRRHWGKLLHYDWHRRVSLLDHFLGDGTDLQALAESRYAEQGNFINQPYTASFEQQTLTLQRTGTVFQGEQLHPIEVIKSITLPHPEQATALIRYSIRNLSEQTVSLWFAPEFNVNLLAGDAPDRYYYLPETESTELHTPLAEETSHTAVLSKTSSPTKLRSKKLISKESLQNVYGIGLRDEWLGLDYHLIWNQLGTVWRFPIETVSQSETGIEKVYQSSAIFPNWKFTLAPGASWHVEITQRIASLSARER